MTSVPIRRRDTFMRDKCHVIMEAKSDVIQLKTKPHRMANKPVEVKNGQGKFFPTVFRRSMVLLTIHCGISSL